MGSSSLPRCFPGRWSLHMVLPLLVVFIGISATSTSANHLSNGGFEQAGISVRTVGQQTVYGWGLTHGGVRVLDNEKYFAGLQRTPAGRSVQLPLVPGKTIFQEIDTLARHAYAGSFNFEAPSLESGQSATVLLSVVDADSGAQIFLDLFTERMTDEWVTRVFKFTAISARTLVTFASAVIDGAGNSTIGPVLDNIVIDALDGKGGSKRRLLSLQDRSLAAGLTRGGAASPPSPVLKAASVSRSSPPPPQKKSPPPPKKKSPPPPKKKSPPPPKKKSPPPPKKKSPPPPKKSSPPPPKKSSPPPPKKSSPPPPSKKSPPPPPPQSPVKPAPVKKSSPPPPKRKSPPPPKKKTPPKKKSPPPPKKSPPPPKKSPPPPKPSASPPVASLPPPPPSPPPPSPPKPSPPPPKSSPPPPSPPPPSPPKSSTPPPLPPSLPPPLTSSPSPATGGTPPAGSPPTELSDIFSLGQPVSAIIPNYNANQVQIVGNNATIAWTAAGGARFQTIQYGQGGVFQALVQAPQGYPSGTMTMFGLDSQMGGNSSENIRFEVPGNQYHTVRTVVEVDGVELVRVHRMDDVAFTDTLNLFTIYWSKSKIQWWVNKVLIRELSASVGFPIPIGPLFVLGEIFPSGITGNYYGGGYQVRAKFAAITAFDSLVEVPPPGAGNTPPAPPISLRAPAPGPPLYPITADYSCDNCLGCTGGWCNAQSSTDGSVDIVVKYPAAGARFSSQNVYATGFFSADIKCSANHTEGLITSFYLSTQEGSRTQDEIDFEFLGKSLTSIQTNVYIGGVGGNEAIHDLGFDCSADFHNYAIWYTQKFIIWYIDRKVVRIALNTEATDGTPYPHGQMHLYASVWDASSICGGCWTGYRDPAYKVTGWTTTMSYRHVSILSPA